MPPPRDNLSLDKADHVRSSGDAGHSPLVIVSERGRHSEASRRIVRSQAARASAAQSRETRARNREDRQQRGGAHSPGASGSNEGIDSPFRESSNSEGNVFVFQGGQQTQNQEWVQVPNPSQDRQRHHQHQRQDQDRDQHQDQDQDQNQDRNIIGHDLPHVRSEYEGGSPLKPLVGWITNVLHLSTTSFDAEPSVFPGRGGSHLANARAVILATGGTLADGGDAMEEVQIMGGLFHRRLPIALPKGFAILQQRIAISDTFLVLISRTACFDFASPGVEDRLHELLFDMVMTSASGSLTSGQGPGHPIQNHLRIACTCLTIFQGQRADGQAFAHDRRYDIGLQAAWDEVTVLDLDALKEPKSAEAALWSIFIISVTCGSNAEFFHQLLFGLLHDLQLRYWEEVRNVLLDFIYPGSFLDEPCRQFFHQLSQSR